MSKQGIQNNNCMWLMSSVQKLQAPGSEAILKWCSQALINPEWSYLLERRKCCPWKSVTKHSEGGEVNTVRVWKETCCLTAERSVPLYGSGYWTEASRHYTPPLSLSFPHTHTHMSLPSSLSTSLWEKGMPAHATVKIVPLHWPCAKYVVVSCPL